MERHQGTLTSGGARSKKYNRRIEEEIYTTELLCSMAFIEKTMPYPKSEIEEIWHEVLLYQFHDILPGTSIRRVYEESHVRYEALLDRLNQLQAKAIDSLSCRSGRVLFNPHSVECCQLVEIGEDVYKVRVPSLGMTEIDSISEKSQLMDNVNSCEIVEKDIVITSDTMENNKVRLTFDKNGNLASLWDKELARECIVETEAANVFKLYDDDGDAWDFAADYRENWESILLVDVKSELRASRAIRTHSYRFGNSTIEQEVCLEIDSALVSFETQVDWREKDKMLRVDFPLNIHTDQVSCDIQFGHIKRLTKNETSQEIAQYEVCAHRWIDLSEEAYGISLINDCKYGYHAKGNLISMNLLRSAKYPGGDYVDIGQHSFKYALYPHPYDVTRSDVISIAALYNQPPIELDKIPSFPL